MFRLFWKQLHITKDTADSVIRDYENEIHRLSLQVLPTADAKLTRDTLERIDQLKREIESIKKEFNKNIFTKPAALDRCVQDLMSDESFTPQAGRTKEESAYAVCTASVEKVNKGENGHKAFRMCMKDIGIQYAGPVPESLLARQDLEEETQKSVTVNDIKSFMERNLSRFRNMSVEQVAHEIRTEFPEISLSNAYEIADDYSTTKSQSLFKDTYDILQQQIDDAQKIISSEASTDEQKKKAARDLQEAQLRMRSMSKSFKQNWKDMNKSHPDPSHDIENQYPEDEDNAEKAQSFKRGDRVKVKEYMTPDGGKKGIVEYVNDGGGVKVKLDDGNSETFADDEIEKSIQKDCVDEALGHLDAVKDELLELDQEVHELGGSQGPLSQISQKSVDLSPGHLDQKDKEFLVNDIIANAKGLSQWKTFAERYLDNMGIIGNEKSEVLRQAGQRIGKSFKENWSYINKYE